MCTHKQVLPAGTPSLALASRVVEADHHAGLHVHGGEAAYVRQGSQGVGRRDSEWGRESSITSCGSSR